ncbi:MAG: FGGY-family carbohydrate kinase [Pseudomonadota bacterium]
MSLRLGIDIGTSGVRSAVIDAGGAVVSSARASHPAQDPDRIDADKWWDAVAACLSAQMTALTDIGRAGTEITGIAVDGTSGSMVLTDAALTPVSPALMYNSKGFDAEASRIAAIAPETHITQGSNSALARAMRLVATADARPVHLLHQADFIAARLMGRGGMSDHNNALKTGFDPGAEAWPDWIGALIDPALLPDVRPVGEALGRVAADIATRFGLSAKAQIHAGTTDSTAAFLASAPLKAGHAVTSLGSTLAVKLLSPTRIDDPATGLYSHRLGDVWLAGGASNTGGAVLAHYFSTDELIGLTQGMAVDPPTGLDYYPLLQPGERFPVNDPTLAPRLAPRPEDDQVFLKAMFEAMARIERAAYQSIADRGGIFPTHVYSAGGGAQNPVWRAIRECALGLPLSEAPQTEASVGVATLAGAPA